MALRMVNGMIRSDDKPEDSALFLTECLEQIIENVVLITDDKGFKEIFNFSEGLKKFTELRYKRTNPKVTVLKDKASKVLFKKKQE